MRGEWWRGDEGYGVCAARGARKGGGGAGGRAPRAATSLCSRSPGAPRFPGGAPSRLRKCPAAPARAACRPRGAPADGLRHLGTTRYSLRLCLSPIDKPL